MGGQEIGVNNKIGPFFLALTTTGVLYSCSNPDLYFGTA